MRLCDNKLFEQSKSAAMTHSASPDRHRRDANGLAHGWTLFMAALLGLIGLALLAGGVWLIALGGSWYQAIAGLGPIGSAAFLFMAQLAGIWVYLMVWIGTWIWAVWEVGFDLWPLVWRVAAPTVLLLFLLPGLPYLRRATQSDGRFASVAGLMLIAAVAGQEADAQQAKTPAETPPEAAVGTEDVDLSDAVGDKVPGWYAVTSPPILVRGVLVVGAQVSDNEAEDAPSGVVRGYDALIGALAVGLGPGQSGPSRSPSRGRGLYPRHTQHVDHRGGRL